MTTRWKQRYVAATWQLSLGNRQQQQELRARLQLQLKKGTKKVKTREEQCQHHRITFLDEGCLRKSWSAPTALRLSHTRRIAKNTTEEMEPGVVRRASASFSPMRRKIWPELRSTLTRRPTIPDFSWVKEDLDSLSTTGGSWPPTQLTWDPAPCHQIGSQMRPPPRRGSWLSCYRESSEQQVKILLRSFPSISSDISPLSLILFFFALSLTQAWLLMSSSPFKSVLKIHRLQTLKGYTRVFSPSELIPKLYARKTLSWELWPGSSSTPSMPVRWSAVQDPSLTAWEDSSRSSLNPKEEEVEEGDWDCVWWEDSRPWMKRIV